MEHEESDHKKESSHTVHPKNTRINNEEKPKNASMGPTVLFLWVWSWFATIPKAVNHLYTDIKNGEFLARFTLLDAMMQFIVAIATSCHPQEDGMSGERQDEDRKVQKEPQKGRKSHDGVDVFGGQGRTLRSRVVEAN